MCVALRGNEARAVGVYLTNLGHHRDVRRRFREAVDEYGREYILSVMKRVPLHRDERVYLKNVYGF